MFSKKLKPIFIDFMKAAKSGTVSHSDEDAVSDVSQENVEFPRLIKPSENKIEVIWNGITNS